MKKFTTNKGEVLIYFGNPDLTMLNDLAMGPGDLWHSSLDQGFKNAFHDIIYQTATFWWYLNDFEAINPSISWRVNPNAFVIRESVWDHVNGLDDSYDGDIIKGLDLGYQLLRNLGGIPLYVKSLYDKEKNDISICPTDRYRFYLKHFKKHHSYYMMLRKGITQILTEYKAFSKAKTSLYVKPLKKIIPPRVLKPIKGNPKVCAIIPTMGRQDFTVKLLEDYNSQTHCLHQVVVVDATPKDERDEALYFDSLEDAGFIIVEDNNFIFQDGNKV